MGMENNSNFMREYHIPSEFSLYDFKQFIASELDFDDSQQSVFFLLDKNGRKTASYSLFDMGDGAMDTVTLADLNGKGMKMLLYTFDFFNNRSLFVEFLGEIEKSPKNHYPFVAQSKGKAPGQFVETREDELPVTEDFDDDDEQDELYYDDGFEM
jgi:hypothetical protein